MIDFSIGSINECSQSIISICRIAWEQGLVKGWSGNASMRISAGVIMITESGSAKGNLKSDNLLLVNNQGEVLSGSGLPSSENALHLELYKAIPECKAILHTHPPYLQALEIIIKQLKLSRNDFLNIPLYESAIWRSKLFFAKNFAPGTIELAHSALDAIYPFTSANSLPCAIWLPNHGLCSLATNLSDALCLTEEMEHLAKVQCLTATL